MRSASKVACMFSFFTLAISSVYFPFCAKVVKIY
nr:MAG TPA: hypothetical protein [Caudoviricetes sp.]